QGGAEEHRTGGVPGIYPVQQGVPHLGKLFHSLRQTVGPGLQLQYQTDQQQRGGAPDGQEQQRGDDGRRKGAAYPQLSPYLLDKRLGDGRQTQRYQERQQGQQQPAEKDIQPCQPQEDNDCPFEKDIYL